MQMKEFLRPFPLDFKRRIYVWVGIMAIIVLVQFVNCGGR